MSRIFCIRQVYGLAVVLGFLAAGQIAVGQDATSKQEQRREILLKRLQGKVSKTSEPIEGFDQVELFEAMESGAIDVRFRAVSSTHANVFVTNNSERPLSIKMPAAFAGVPVMAQQGLGGLGAGGGGQQGGGLGGGLGGGQQGGQNQGTGGGFGGGQGGGGLGGGQGGGLGGGGLGGGGAFNIPSGESGKLSVVTVCLEHGKPDPVPSLEYTIAPLSVLTNDPAIEQLCRLMANDQVSTQVAQAAAWNIANGLSWNELLVKNREERMDGSFIRFFNQNELLAAQQAVNYVRGQAALVRADEPAKPEVLTSEERRRKLEQEFGGEVAAEDSDDTDGK